MSYTAARVRIGRIVEHLGDADGVDGAGDPESASGSTSLANPVSMPVVKNDTPPARAASRSGSVNAGSTASGYTKGTTEHDTTFLPALRIDTMSSTASSGRRLAVGCVDHHFGFTAEQCGRVGGRDHADRVDAAQFPGISSCLCVAVHDQVRQLQFGVIDHPPQGNHTHRTGSPDRHSYDHRSSKY